MRSKWDERHYADGRSYGEGTLEEACRGAVYQQAAAHLPTKGDLDMVDAHFTDLGNARRIQTISGKGSGRGC